MAKLRSMKSDEDIDYDKIIARQNKRETRRNRSTDVYLEEKQNAKEGMRAIREHGPLIDFSNRETIPNVGKEDTLFEWKAFQKRSKKHSDILEQKQPDIFARINESHRLEKEKDRERKEREDKTRKEGIWEYNPEMDEYWWTGDGEPDYFDDGVRYDSPTEEDRQRTKEAEERWMKANIAEEKQARKEKRQKKDKERREAMRKPIAPLPAQEMCRYEQIREDIIKERNEAMAQCKFFENLLEAKTEMKINSAVNQREIAAENDKKKSEQRPVISNTN